MSAPRTHTDGRDWFWTDAAGNVWGPFLVEADAQESMEQTTILAALDAAADAEPKRDGRYLARHAPLRKRQ